MSFLVHNCKSVLTGQNKLFHLKHYEFRQKQLYFSVLFHTNIQLQYLEALLFFAHANEYLKAQMKKWKAVHIWNPITLKVETGWSGVQVPPELHSESETYRLQKIQNAKQNEKQK